MDRSGRGRMFGLVLIGLAIAALAWFLFGTEAGERWTDRQRVREFIRHHPTVAPLIFVVAYVGATFTMAPTWWAQWLAGYCFGWVQGTILCQLGNALAAYAMVLLAEWLTAGVSLRKVEPMLDRLRAFQRRLGSTGIPLVLAVRLALVVPFGPANVAFGLMKLRPRDVAIGTLLGNVSPVAFYCLLGSRGLDVRTEWRQVATAIAVLLAVNVLLAAPLIVQYVRRKGERDRASEDGKGH